VADKDSANGPSPLYRRLLFIGRTTVRYFTLLLVALCVFARALYAAGQNDQRVGKAGTRNPEAYALYLKGRSYWNKRTLPDLETALSCFNQAIAKDPGYALAYAALADAYAVLPDYGGTPSEDIPKSNAAASKALELDATLARPHAANGLQQVQARMGFCWWGC
jgi:tetratricopeptide (TPR) repeat protein